jgi:purine-nucleoside/S-methyl-5'-thioadenosine phosphorylase / adenosine deaminase
MPRAAENRSLAQPPAEFRGWAMRRAAGLDILTANLLAAIPWLVHGFSTRRGGESRLGSERVLNLGLTDWDTREAVVRNRRRLLRALDAREMPLVALRQIHSDVAHVVSAPPAEPLQGDALLTGEPALLLAVQAADCVPILLVDRVLRAVAAVHAGWRGTLARVAVKALGRMRAEFGTRPEDVVAALGPAIGRCCYEVGPEVAQAFAGQFAPAAEWFDGPFARLAMGEEPNPLPWLTMTPPGHEPPPERVQLDLRAANRWQLIDAGVAAGNIATSALCTACRTDLLFSYRREGAATGRLMGVVGVRVERS